MGLDMYLSAKRYIGQYRDADRDDPIVADIDKLDLPFRVTEVIMLVKYWRKANAIHNWFVVNVQAGKDNCKEYYVSRDQLTELLALCLSVKDDPSKAEELLPTKSGFFFGDIEYDAGYFQDIDETIEALEKALKANTDTLDFYYEASW
jgi:hypothetical protein